MNQDNKQASVALVTGAARRIGKAIAEILHTKGFRLAIHCNHSIEEANLFADKLNKQRAHSALVFKQDLNLPEASEKLIKDVTEKLGSLNLLVNNASIFKTSSLITLEEFDELFNTNVKIPYALSLAAFPHLAKKEGCIINLTDIHAKTPLRNYAAYCQTKAALEMQTKALAKEFAPKVRVNAVAPGAIAWPEEDNALSADKKKKIINETPLKQHGDPQFIAKAVLALVENPFITGQILAVDGGRSI